MLEKIKTLLVSIVLWFANIKWKTSSILTDEDQANIEKLLMPDYYIIVTRRNNYLSTHLISLAYLFLRGKIGYYSHILMNLEDDATVEKDFRLIEATGTGVHYSLPSEVFNCSSVALLKPKNITLKEWTNIMDKAKEQLGKKYDSLFDLKTDQELSCVELVRIALQALPDYNTKFAHFEKLITESKNLHPQMFVDCHDFEIVYEIKR